MTRDTRKVLLLLAGVTLLRLLLLPLIGLGDAEAYYWVWSQHPQLGYYDHAPGIAWLIRLFTEIGSSTPFWVRLGPVLVFPATVYLLVLLGRELAPDDRGVGFRTALLCCVTPALALGGISASPDTLLALFWAGFTLLLVRALTRGSGAALLGAGACLGLALVAKYFAVLLFPLLLVIFLRREHRRWWRRPVLYAAGVLALAGMLPAVIWNAQNDWISFSFHLAQRHGAAGLSLANLGRLVGGQLAYLSPVLLPGLLWAAIECWSRGRGGYRWRSRDHRGLETRGQDAAGSPPGGGLGAEPFGLGAKPHTDRGLIARGEPVQRTWSVLFWLTTPYLLFWFLATLLTPEAEPHWPLMGYLPLFPALAALWPGRLARAAGSGQRRLRRAGIAAVVVALALDLVVHVHVLTPWLARAMPDALYAANARWDIGNELHGWPEVGRALRERVRAGQGSFVFAYHYTLCSQLSLALHPAVPVRCPNRRTDAFDLLGLGEGLAGADGIFVGDWRYQDPPDTVVSCAMLDPEPELFEVFRGGLKAREFRFWRCRGYGGLSADGDGGR